MRSRNRRRGVVLILTLLLLLVLVVVVGQLSYTTAIDRILASNQAGDLIVDQALGSGVQYAVGILLNDASKAEGEGGRAYDAPNEPWASPWQQKIGEATVTGQLIDCEGKFNLMWLYYYAAEETADQAKLDEIKAELTRLLEHLRDGSSPDGKTLAGNIATWIEGKQKESVLNAKVKQALKGRKLGGSALPIYTLAELLLITDVTAQVLYGEVDSTQETVTKEQEEKLLEQALVRHLTLWGTGKLNINTASKSVLMSVHADVTEDIAQAIIDRRKGDGKDGQVKVPYEKDEDAWKAFSGDTKSPLYKAAKEKVVIASNTFVLDLTATWRTYTKRVWVVLRRDGKRNKVTILQYLPR